MNQSGTKKIAENIPEAAKRNRNNNETSERTITLMGGFASAKQIINADKLYRKAYAPKPETFDGIDEITKEDIEADQKVIKYLHETDEPEDKLEKADTAFAELLIIEGINGDEGFEDWFYDTERYGKEKNYHPITAVPTAEIDNRCGHVEIVVVAKNEAIFGGESIPFAIDVTIRDKYCEQIGPKKQSEEQEDKKNKIFEWIHIYGKADQFKGSSARETSHSEFDRRIYGPAGARSKGLKIPGFAAVKYYEDTTDSSKPILKKGRINVMPRFVVGLERKTLDILKKGKPQLNGNSDPLQYRADIQKYNRALNSARWCILFEIAQQTKDIDKYVSNLTNAEISDRDMDLTVLSKARTQIKALCAYFEDAVKVGEEKAKENQETKQGMVDARNDRVLNTIITESSRVYDRQQVIVA